ncbi:MAG: MgtC/SapB family protein, partial [Candidatus Peregrinibacteria bacterium]|nr:MgtC/SapB family protein [Candidatus Peregrinibacteria bacterium]
IASALGAFLGLRREIVAQNGVNNKVGFMGFRTMTLLAAMGAISTFFSASFYPIIFFTGILILIAIAYAHGSFAENKIGLTTELSAILVFWIGVLVGLEKQFLAIAITIFLASLNAFKEHLHGFAKTLTEKEWFGAFQLFLFSAAVLPFLPTNPVDQWGVFVPFNVWLLVLLISGLGFVGYFLIKFFGARGGIPLTAFLGAIVSSTGVTTSLSAQAKKSRLSGIFAVGILIASATMQIRVLGEILLLGTSDFYNLFLVVPIVMAISSLIMAFYIFKRTSKKHFGFLSFKPEVELEQPFEIGPALKFGIIFVIVIFAAEFGQIYFADYGVYAAAAFSGLIDIDAIVLTSLEAVKLGNRTPAVAQNAIAIALFMNTMIKILYVSFLGPMSLTRKIAITISVSSLLGGIMFLFV